MSDRERYQRAKEIFHSALQLEGRARAAYLAEACAGDELLRQEVQRLLAGDRQADSQWELAVEAEVTEQFAAAYQSDKAFSLVGQKLNNRYFIEAKLGQGSFGAAYLAFDEQMHSKRVVVKVLLPEKGQSEWVQKKFRQEVKALVRINHPGVVGAFDSGSTPDGKLFFVMEFVEGLTLRSVMSAEGMKLERVANIVQQLGRALSAAHDRGVYHRDLKPENIMLQSPGEEEQVKIIDFGMATVKESFDEETKLTVAAGTIPYMAPEQLQGRPSAATDIYALATIAYEMLTGRPPFDTTTFSNRYAAMYRLLEWQQEGIKVKPKELRPDLPSAAQEEILKALSYNPKDRHTRVRDFGDKLANALITKRGEPVSAPAKFETALTEKINTLLYAAEAAIPVPLKFPVRLWLPVAAIILLVAGIVGVIGLPYIKNSVGEKSDRAATANEREHTLSYWGELRQYRNNVPVGEATRLTGGIAGETYFNAGDGLRFFVTPSDDGYLYLINEEARPGNAEPRYTILFPSPAANGGSSKVNRDEQVATSECIFDESVGTEKVWIIWSAGQVEELDKAVRQWSNPKESGEIKETGQAAFLSNFIGKYGGAKLQVEQDEVNEWMKLRGKGDVLVYSLKLKHR